MDAPLWGDTGGHIGAAPTNLRNIFPRIPHKQNNHLRAIQPNETRKLSTHTSGAEMHRALPPPLLKIKKCVYRYDFSVTVDDAICFKISYSFGVTVASP